MITLVRELRSGEAAFEVSQGGLQRIEYAYVDDDRPTEFHTNQGYTVVLKARRGQQGIVGCVTATPPQTLGMQPLAEPRAGTEEKLEAGTAPGKEGRGKQIVKLDTIPVGEEFKGKTHVKAWTETCRGYLASIGGRPGDRTYFFNYSEGGNKGDVQVSRGQNAVINTSDGHEITLIFESGGMDTSVRIEVRK